MICRARDGATLRTVQVSWLKRTKISVVNQITLVFKSKAISAMKLVTLVFRSNIFSGVKQVIMVKQVSFVFRSSVVKLAFRSKVSVVKLFRGKTSWCLEARYLGVLK